MASPRRPSGPSRWRKVPRGPYARVSASPPVGRKGGDRSWVRYAGCPVRSLPRFRKTRSVPSGKGRTEPQVVLRTSMETAAGVSRPRPPAAEPRGTAPPTRPARARPAPSASGRRDGSSSARRSRCEGAGVERPKSASHSGAAAGRGETSSTRASSVLEPGCPGSATSTSAAMPAVSFPASFDDTKASACQVSSDLPRTWATVSPARTGWPGTRRCATSFPPCGATIDSPARISTSASAFRAAASSPFLECGGGGAFGAPHPVLGGARDPPRDPGLALRLRQADPGDRLPRFEGVPDVGQPLDDVPEHGGDHGMALARLDQHRLDRQAALHAPEHRPGEEREQRQAESGQHHPLVGRRDLEPLVEGLRARPARDRLLPEDLVVEEHDAMLSSGPICRLYIQQDSAHRPRHHDRQRGQRPDPAICTRAIYPHIVRPDTSTAETERRSPYCFVHRGPRPVALLPHGTPGGCAGKRDGARTGFPGRSAHRYGQDWRESALVRGVGEFDTSA